MSRIPHLKPEGKVCISESDCVTEKRARLIRPEQKSVMWIKDMDAKFSGAGELVVCCFTEMFATGKAFLLFPQHCRFVCCGA